ncbi:hypothetical protein [Vibrio vulnificus]|uniref:hypothetical protein n=1 Tax=Vibrio vulnificus TaxID=672 RepID=UPI001022D4C2|nr:hypothetical protein [Vibrio vulnificus]RZP68419.1 hypothetical protein D8T45_04485 [Vibrio vulnificus]RZR15302.1 hypothetical protein D8T24_10850 [Vibrio vulnificus]
MAARGKPNKGHENVRKHAEESRKQSLDRLKARIALFRRLINERKENLISMEGLPRNPTKFLDDGWLPEVTNLAEIKVSRATLYKKEDEFISKLNEVTTLCKTVKEPENVAKEKKASEAEIERLTIRTQNLAELNTQIEHEYQQQIEELQTRISELLEENERLESILANRSSNVTSIF